MFTHKHTVFWISKACEVFQPDLGDFLLYQCIFSKHDILAFSHLLLIEDEFEERPQQWKDHVTAEGGAAVTRIRTGVAAATTQSTDHYTITAGYCSGLTSPERTVNKFQ